MIELVLAIIGALFLLNLGIVFAIAFAREWGRQVRLRRAEAKAAADREALLRATGLL